MLKYENYTHDICHKNKVRFVMVSPTTKIYSLNECWLFIKKRGDLYIIDMFKTVFEELV